MAAEYSSGSYPDDGKLRPSWDEIDLWATELADRVEAHCLETGEKFDKMIVIPRGSYPVVNVLARRFGFKVPDLVHMGITTYEDGEITSGDEFIYGDMPTQEQVRGMDVLIVEEVCDTGKTLTHATELLQLAGVGLLRVATLHYKPTKTTTGFVPDWYAGETDKWIVYPWEKHEEAGKKSIVKRAPNKVAEAA